MAYLGIHQSEDRGDAQRIRGFYPLMLRPGQTLRLTARLPSMVFHRVEGGAKVQIDARQFTVAVAGTCCAPGYTAATLTNPSTSKLFFPFLADESTLKGKPGVYEIRD